MKKHVRYSLVYNPKKRTNKNGRALIYVCAYLPGENRQYFSTDIEILPSEWDARRRQVNARSPYMNYWNAECASLINKLVEIEMLLRLRGRQVSLYNIRQEYRKQNLSPSFYHFVEQHLLKETGRSERTLLGRKSVYNSLRQYAPDLDFKDLTSRFLKDYEQYLYRKKNKPATVTEYLTIFRVFIRSAVRYGCLQKDENPFSGYRFRKADSVRKGITAETLENLENMSFPESEGRLAVVRDLFLFSCYTGLRFSDIVRLRTEHIIHEDGKRYLRMRTQKNGRDICVPLDGLFGGKAERLLRRHRTGDRIFPLLANNRVNELLKIIGERLDAPQPLTFHQARHTFASILAEKGANPYTIQFLMGHTSIKTSMIYVTTCMNSIEADLSRIGVL